MKTTFLALLMALLPLACGGSSSSSDAGADGGGQPDAACFMNSTSHVEIINACTNAVTIWKSPVLPLLYPDGGLPPLP
jgi:hypothetical protein